jgi:hypothetical protein
MLGRAGWLRQAITTTCPLHCKIDGGVGRMGYPSCFEAKTAEGLGRDGIAYQATNK